MHRALKFAIIMVCCLIIGGNAQSKDYPFQPGMGLGIFTYPDTSSMLNQIFPIQQNGEVDLPILGRVAVSKLTEVELLKLLQNTYSQYVRSTNVQVYVYYRISLLGGFENPGLYYVRPEESLWDAVRRSGGFLDDKGFRRLNLYRGGKKIKGDLSDAYSSHLSLKSIGVVSGDVITTPIPTPPVDKTSRLIQIMTLVTGISTIYILYLNTMAQLQRTGR